MGSASTSFSEVAAYLGGAGGKPLPVLVAGRDFGPRVDYKPPSTCSIRTSKWKGVHGCGDAKLKAEPPLADSVNLQHFWPKPFA